MASGSGLDPNNIPETPDRVLGKGHGTGALGPSDSSDSGSDIAGGNVGPDVGDANLDSDSDAEGTGERAAAGRDTDARDGGDIDTDHIETISDEVLDEDDLEFLSSRPPGPAPRRVH